MLERAHKGTFHKMSPKHLDRYVKEFAGKNFRESDTLDQMAATVVGLMGRELPYRKLIADNGLNSGARTCAWRSSARNAPAGERRKS